MEETYIVYARADQDGRVIGIASGAFLRDPTGWTEIDRGEGDRYLHAQGNYLPHALRDEHGVWRYRLDGGQIVERPEAERTADRPAPAQSDAGRIAALEAAFGALMGGVERAR